MKVVIVIPTYNEKENIEILIPQILKEFKKIKHNMNILVVDDKSPDKTADAVKKLKIKHKNIHLISGNKQGLGVAYVRGFDHAIKKLKADVVFEMDADLQHPPNLIPDFMAQIDKGYDVVIGSRYIKGGATPDWGIKRKLISRGANMFARFVSGLFKVNDCTSGYRAIRTKTLNKINPEFLSTKGYAFQITLLYELMAAGAKVGEIPLVFYDRQKGESKLQTKDMIEFFLNSFRLRFRSTQRMIKFAAVGANGIIVNLGMFATAKTILYPLFGQNNATLLASSLAGDEVSIIFNFYLNSIWTFKHSNNNDHYLVKLAKFHIIAISGIIITNSILFILYKGFGIWDIGAKFIGILCAFLWNYLLNTKYTWRERID